jgi:hypothetical protein
MVMIYEKAIAVGGIDGANVGDVLYSAGKTTSEPMDSSSRRMGRGRTCFWVAQYFRESRQLQNTVFLVFGLSPRQQKQGSLPVRAAHEPDLSRPLPAPLLPARPACETTKCLRLHSLCCLNPGAAAKLSNLLCCSEQMRRRHCRSVHAAATVIWR